MEYGYLAAAIRLLYNDDDKPVYDSVEVFHKISHCHRKAAADTHRLNIHLKLQLNKGLKMMS